MNLVFDIDGCIARAIDYNIKEKTSKIVMQYGKDFFEHHTFIAFDYIHFIYPGFYALFKWLNEKGCNLMFFSSGINERNIEFAEKFMFRTFGDNPPQYLVYSREHCIDTERMNSDEMSKYQGHFWGNKKKKLSDIVVPKEALDQTLLIDDDTSYICAGEEYNFIKVRYDGGDVPIDTKLNLDNFCSFYKSFMLAGLLEEIFEYARKEKCNLITAAKYIQVDKLNTEISKQFYFPLQEDLQLFKKGLEILQKQDSYLNFLHDFP